MKNDNTDALLDDIIKIVDKEGFFATTTSGVSMYPMLRDRKDTIVITKAPKKLKKYDVPLYKTGDTYILHRIIKVLPDGYITRGDNLLVKEYVKPEQILGVLQKFYRTPRKEAIETTNKMYRIYIFIWHHTFGLRYLYKKFKSMLRKLLKK